jgi:hypothetical protein
VTSKEWWLLRLPLGLINAVTGEVGTRPNSSSNVIDPELRLVSQEPLAIYHDAPSSSQCREEASLLSLKEGIDGR